jgi:hypothetical protein
MCACVHICVYVHDSYKNLFVKFEVNESLNACMHIACVHDGGTQTLVASEFNQAHIKYIHAYMHCTDEYIQPWIQDMENTKVYDYTRPLDITYTVHIYLYTHTLTHSLTHTQKHTCIRIYTHLRNIKVPDDDACAFLPCNPSPCLKNAAVFWPCIHVSVHLQ